MVGIAHHKILNLNHNRTLSIEIKIMSTSKIKSINLFNVLHCFCALAHTQNGVKRRYRCRCSNFERVVQDALTWCIGNSIIVKVGLNFLILKENDTSKNSFIIRERDVWFNLMEKHSFSKSISKFDRDHKTFTAHHAYFLERRYVFIVFVERLFPFRLNNLF